MVKYRRRIFVYIIVILSLGGFLTFSCLGTWKQIYDNKKTKEELSDKYNKLLESEETLEGQVVKLQDTDYVLKYAREKYFFVKPGEYIIDTEFSDDDE
jgi:cell division protein FtsB